MARHGTIFPGCRRVHAGPGWSRLVQLVWAGPRTVRTLQSRFEVGSGAGEYALVQELGTIVQGTRTAPEGSEKGFVYLVYTPTVVAKHLRACFPVAAYKQ